MFTFSVGSQNMNTMLMTPTAQNTDATAFQLTGTLYILWLSMKMNVSTALKLIFSKMVILCLTMSPWIRGTHLFLLSMIEEVKEHLQTSIFVTIHTAVSHFYMDNFGYTFHSSAMYKSRIVSCWFSKTSSTICAVFKFS